MQRGLFWTVLVAVVPLLIAQLIIYAAWFQARRAAELDVNLQIARGVATAFHAFLRDIHREELILGLAMEAREGAFLNESSRFLKEGTREYPKEQSWAWASADGTIVASTTPSSIGQNVRERDYFQELLAGKKWIVSNLLVGKGMDEQIFVVGRRVDDPQGKLRGVMLAAVRPQELEEVLRPFQRSDQGAIAVFDSTGTLVYRSAGGVPGDRRWYDSDRLLQTALGEQQEQLGITASPDDGGKRFAAFVPVADFGWAVAAKRPVDAAMAPVLYNLALVAGLNVLVVTVSLFASRYLSQKIIGPVRQLQQQAHAIGQGDLESRTEIRGVEELAQLADTLNVMAENLQKSNLAREEAMEELTRSNQELEQFAYVASHDLQEPLRVISGYLQLLERRYRGQLDAEADEFINYVLDGARQLQQLINDLLEYSRVGSRGKPLRPTDMNDAFERTVAGLGAKIEENRATVTRDALPMVQADSVQMVQLLQNLIANALKFRGSEPPEVHISARRDGPHWQFAVRDNGIGIDPKYQDRIFAIFQRLHTRKKYSGTGIGLAVCKRIVERHGGRIWVESEPGKGSTFLFTINPSQSNGESR